MRSYTKCCDFFLMKTWGLQEITLQSAACDSRLLTCFKDPGYNLLSIAFAQNRGLFAFKKVIYLLSWILDNT